MFSCLGCPAYKISQGMKTRNLTRKLEILFLLTKRVQLQLMSYLYNDFQDHNIYQ